MNEDAYPCTATWFHNDCKVSSGVDRVSITHGSITDGEDDDGKTCEFRLSVKAWLPDGYSRILRSCVFGPSGFWTMAPLRCAAKFDPFLS